MIDPRALAVALLVAGATFAGDGPGPAVVRVGSGSYLASPPVGAKRPPTPIHRTDALKGPTPTNDWWSSLAWPGAAERQYPHPLAVRPEAAGLRVFDPGSRLSANRVGIFGTMPDGPDDLVLGHSAGLRADRARLDGFGDWHVSARFQAKGGGSMRVSYAHGSPFVFARFEGGTARVQFRSPPKVWSGGSGSSTLGVTIYGSPYALFGPTGSTWEGQGSATLTNRSTRDYASVALLPDASEASLALFQSYAHSHVVGTRVDWEYQPRLGRVAATFRFETEAREPGRSGTLTALYPHQWHDGEFQAAGPSYRSVRGELKLVAGESFGTHHRVPGLLPCLPDVGASDRGRMLAMIRAEVGSPDPPARDTYWEGKWLGRIATLVPIAEAYGFQAEAAALADRLRRRLERWFTAIGPDGRPKAAGLFALDSNWGTLIGYPASFGSDDELNDHHFHHGYFLKAAAEVARRDPAWAAEQRWGGMVDLLIRDIASGDRRDPLFPFLRNFDPYAGHSWASGHARFADGNNNESSSEAMNAWAGMVLWGEATGDRAIRDRGVFLYATEASAIREYWFDAGSRNRPAAFTPSVATMIWGGKGVNETWFTANPEAVHAINWLPIHGGSLYLGRDPAYAARNYAALLAENKGPGWDEWPDLVAMYRALSDPADALRQFDSADRRKFEAGNSPANAYHWITTLGRLGPIAAEVTADDPLAVAFDSSPRSYHAFNLTDRPRTVTFSDGHRMELKARGPAVSHAGR